MKTKKVLLQYLVVAATVGIIFTGCKKDEHYTPLSNEKVPTVKVKPTAAESAKQTQNASDQSNMEAQTDESMDDVNSILNNNSSLRSLSGPCNVTVDSSAQSSGLITINYNGLSCDGKRFRTGSIAIQLPSKNGQLTKWSDTNVTASITYTNFKVMNVSDSSSVEFNGGYGVTNVTGGNVFTVAAGDSIVHMVRGDMTITFTDSTTSTVTWGVAKTRTFYKSTALFGIFSSFSTKVTGDTALNGNTNVAVWGTNRAGEAFSVAITTPIINDGSCGFFKPTGVKVYRKGTEELTITYGVDINGDAVTSGTCPYGYKLSWTDSNGNAKELIKPYWF